MNKDHFITVLFIKCIYILIKTQTKKYYMIMFLGANNKYCIILTCLSRKDTTSVDSQ